MNITFVDFLFSIIFFSIGFVAAETSRRGDSDRVQKSTIQTTIILLLGSLITTVKKAKDRGIDLNEIDHTELCQLVVDEYHSTCKSITN